MFLDSTRLLYDKICFVLSSCTCASISLPVALSWKEKERHELMMTCIHTTTCMYMHAEPRVCWYPAAFCAGGRRIKTGYRDVRFCRSVLSSCFVGIVANPFQLQPEGNARSMLPRSPTSIPILGTLSTGTVLY